jgi:hypothetical protein
VDPIFLDLVKFYGIPGAFMIGGALWLKTFFDNYFAQQTRDREGEQARQVERETHLTARLQHLEDWSRDELAALLRANTVALDANTKVHSQVLEVLEKRQEVQL